MDIPYAKVEVQLLVEPLIRCNQGILAALQGSEQQCTDVHRSTRSADETNAEQEKSCCSGSDGMIL